ncbi:hypothetical protein [Chitinophaga pinensis]|uniref:hypothetical protein n=1 Tax=Chitinophaga pinensis TaxID=79329 RepID=UPI0011D1CAD5|nr:hypothetical protein [Chitinophaga pinensis]
MLRAKLIMICIFAIALSAAVYAAFKTSEDPARCNIYLRAIESENLCTVAAPNLALSPVKPGEAPLMTIYATAISGTCGAYHEVYSCY